MARAGAGVWLPFMAALSERYDVIVPDHPGFGRSDTPDWLDNYRDLAYFYLDFIDALGSTSVHLVGHLARRLDRGRNRGARVHAAATLTLIGAAGIHVKGVRQGRHLHVVAGGARRAICSSIRRFAEQRLAQPVTERAGQSSR